MFANKLMNVSSYGLRSCRMYSRITNKRITRLSSDVEIRKDEISSQGNESNVGVKLINRNPRNLEQLLFEQKPLGFELDLPSRTFWNKVVLEKSSKYLTAKIVHYSGRVLVSASTREVAIREQLTSLSDANAAENIGQILARRALESGIIQCYVENVNEDKSTKVKAFYESLKNNGLVLEEQPFIFPRRRRDM